MLARPAVQRVLADEGSALAQALLVAPGFHRQLPVRRLGVMHEHAGATPAMLLVERGRRGSLPIAHPSQASPTPAVANRASASASSAAAAPEPRACEATKQVVELVAFDDAEPIEPFRCAGHARPLQCRAQPRSEILQRADARQSRRHDQRMRVVPRAVPQPRQGVDFCPPARPGSASWTPSYGAAMIVHLLDGSRTSCTGISTGCAVSPRARTRPGGRGRGRAQHRACR